MSRIRYLLTLALCMSAPLTALAQWEPEVRLTDNPAESVTCFDNGQCVAAAGATIHVVWHDSRDGDTEIYYKRSTDNGTTWGTDTRITTDASWSERPSVAVNGSDIHVVWYDGRLGPPRIFYKHSSDNGTTWGSDVALTPTAGVGYHPSVAVSGSIVHVAWTDMSAGPQIYYTRSVDNGATWETARNITPTAPPAGKNLASIAVSGSIVHVTWMDTRTGPRIYYTRSLDSGVTWETDRGITPMPSQFASVAVSGSIVHVVYADFRAASDAPKIYYTRSLDNGLNWETEVPLAEDLTSWYPSVAVDGSHVHAVWPDNRNGDISEIYYRDSLDDGATWEPEVRLTNNLSESREPSVAVSGAYVHVVWGDDRDQNWEIYYDRGAMGGVRVEQPWEPGPDQDLQKAPPVLVLNQPNPFNPNTEIRYWMERAAGVTLSVFDLRGHEVCVLVNATQPAGWNAVRWDGRDAAGKNVPTGVYVARMEMESRVVNCRMMLVR